MLGNILVQIGADISDMTQGLKQAGSDLNTFAAEAGALGGEVAGSFGVASGAVAGGLAAAVAVAADFDTAMRKAGAIAGASAEELGTMEAAALELGATTSQSATSVAEAMTEMAAKGYSALEVVDAMPGVISAAEASGESLALAADTVASSMNIFGLEAAEAGRVADILAATANGTAAGIGDMSYALKYAGTPAASLGYSLEETAAAIGLMTNAGLDGSSAGTALAGSMYALVNAGDKQQKVMDELGISVLDASGEMKSMSDLVREFNGATEGMTDAQRTAAVQTILGTEAAKGFLSLMSAGPDAIDEMTVALENSAGASAAAGEEMGAGIGGAIGNMTGALETLAILIGDQLVPYVQKAAEFITMLATKFNEASPAVQKFITFGAVLFVAITGLIAVIGTFAVFISAIFSAFSSLAAFVGLLGGALTGLGGVFAFLLNPVTLIIGAITAVVAALVYVYNNCEWFKEALNGIWQAIVTGASTIFGGLGEIISSALGGVGEFFTGLFSSISSMWSDNGEEVKATAGETYSGVGEVISSHLDGIKESAQSALSTISDYWTENTEGIRTTVSDGYETVKGAVMEAVGAISDFVSSQLAVLNDFWAEHGAAITGFLSGAYETAKNAVMSSLDGIKSFVLSSIEVMKSAWSIFVDVLKTIVQVGLTGISVTFTLIFGIIKNTIVTAWNLIVAATQIAWAVLKTVISVGIQLITGIISVAMSVLQGNWKGAWNKIKNIATSIMNTITGTFKGINLVQIGKNIVQGLVNGIGSLKGKVTAKVRELASSIPASMKKLLGIHSPSRTMRDEVGQWIPAGIIVAIEEGISGIKRASQKMVAASIPDFKTTLKLAEKERSAAQRIVALAMAEDANEINKIKLEASKEGTKIEQEANTKIVALKADAAKKVKALTKKSKTTAKDIYADLNESIKKVEQKKAEDLLKIEDKLRKDVEKITESTTADKLKALKEYVDAQKQAGNMSTKQEAEFWHYSSKAFTKGTQENTETLKLYNKAVEDLQKERFDNEKKWIEERKDMNAMSARDEIVALNEFMKGYQKGTDEYNHFMKAAQDARQSMADDLVSTNQTYVDKMKDISEQLVDNEKEVNDRYESALQSRYNTIRGYYGLLDEVKEREEPVKSSDLMKNLSMQVNSLRDWQQQLQDIKSRGVSDALYNELLDLGVDATAELKALNAMSDKELTRYGELFTQKSKVAYAQAVRELAPMKEATQTEIEAMRKAATKEIQQLQTEWQTEIVKIVHGTDTSFSTLKQVGQHAIEGLRDGMMGMSGELAKAAASLAKVIEDSIRGVLEIHSPSRALRKLGVFGGTGLTLGLEDTETQVAKAAAALAQAATPNVTPTDFNGYASKTTTQMESKLQTQFADDAKQRQGDFVLAVDGYELARVQKAHISNMMNREASLMTTVRGL